MPFISLKNTFNYKANWLLHFTRAGFHSVTTLTH